MREQIEASSAPVVVSGLRYAASAPIPTAEIALPRHPRDLTIDNDGDIEALLEVVDLTIGALA
ncbi:hypothetical protein VL04_17345 [Chromobacterium violaceum]|uniref:hypothetical protein n=1 Tax=Chromobacterium violaceum TaxID=536 RepID=UPI000652A8CF|nr:hypothetical protein [Chromobacterium violaceum]KMN48737.1 hypothetical protein VK93_14610 [Chromobacterium violaceum]KMN87832.1 hypothetical protein VL02_00605 [Chromobacterium violaceum]KMN89060.1 hypothetical protein VL04_17345 [Chromobacterium violaceum]KMO05435.1 hypothetical protein VL16_02590 [Chromobacterium violaceum]